MAPGISAFGKRPGKQAPEKAEEKAKEPEPGKLESEKEVLPEVEKVVENDPLPEGWDYLNKEGLQDQCRERGLADDGTKKELRDRLQAWQDAFDAGE